MSAPIYQHEPWYQLLQQSVSAVGVSATARRLGYRNHTGTSLALKGCYRGDIGPFAARVQEKLGQVACPHTGSTLPLADCHSLALAAAPTHNPLRLAHWRACRNCPHRPKEEA